MSIAQQAALYRESTGTVTTQNEIDQALATLEAGKSKWQKLAMPERIRLAEACLDGMYRVVNDWVNRACAAKGIDPGDPTRSEEIGNGPLATARYLRLLIQSLRDIERLGAPQLPGTMHTGPDGRLRVQVVPTKGLFDGVAFQGFKSEIWMQPGVTRENLQQTQATWYREGRQESGIALVLGAGNVSSIPPTDAFSKLFQEGKVVLLKMNPVNEYLGPVFERAFAPLIREGYLQIIYGGADVGAYATAHRLVDEVHITGSVYSHHTIVWGPPGEERERRMAANDPLLKKRITSELGNVTPWIVVPAEYTDAELKFQAENLASTIVNNGSFNCIATKMIVTSRSWPQRDRFINYLQQVLAQVKPRQAYYPGAEERFRKFAHEEPQGCPAGALPWKLIRDIDCERQPLYCQEESFVCVVGETALDARDSVEFLSQATDFANNRLWGTLGAAVMVPPRLRKDAAFERAFQKTLADLRYGTIAINHWPALSYALMSPPWGGYPGGTLHDPQSGIGWVHNTYMLEKAEKTVLEGPLTMFPKPLWFPTNRGAERTVWKVLELYRKPSVWKLPALMFAAMRT
jgi:hypothetical protein